MFHVKHFEIMVIQNAIDQGLQLIASDKFIVNELLVTLASARLSFIAAAHKVSNIRSKLIIEDDDSYLQWTIEGIDEPLHATKLYLGNTAIPDYLAAIAFNLALNQRNLPLKGLTIPRATENIAHLQDYPGASKWQIYPF